MKYIIYSVNIGGYDFFNEPKVIDNNVRYILFTDNKYLKSNVWEIHHVDFLSHLDNRLKSRYIKLNPSIVLPEHDISLWVDHTFTPKISNFEEFLKTIKFKDISLYKHRIRDCIFDEAIKVISVKKEYESVVNRQINKYINEGFPKKYGLCETGFMVRNNNDKINLFNSLWWSEIKNGSGRDQLSQMYTSWKTNTKIDMITVGKSAYENPFVDYLAHITEYKIK